MKKSTKKEIKRIVNELDNTGSNLTLSVLRHMDSESIYYTSVIAKKLRHTWANTYKAVNKLAKMGLIKTAEYIGAYRTRYDNIKGLVLTKHGHIVKSEIFKRKKTEEGK